VTHFNDCALYRLGIQRCFRKVEAQTRSVGANVEPIAINSHHHCFTNHLSEYTATTGAQGAREAGIHSRNEVRLDLSECM